MTFNPWFSGFLGPQACATTWIFVNRALNLFYELSGEGRYSLPYCLQTERKGEGPSSFWRTVDLRILSKVGACPLCRLLWSQWTGRVPRAKLEKVSEPANYTPAIPASRFLPRVPSLTSLCDGFWPASMSQCILSFLRCCRSEGFITVAERKVGGMGCGVPYQELTTYIYFNLGLSSLKNYLKYVSVT